MERISTDIGHLEVLPGIGVVDLQPFVHYRAVSADENVILFGQLSVDELRHQAVMMLEAGFVAENDARLVRLCREIGLADDVAGALISGLEKLRAGE